jgi:hypothetical protein
MTDCPRVMTKEQMESGLKAVRSLFVDRKDAPELPELREWERLGFVASELQEFDQYSRLKYSATSLGRTTDDWSKT